MGMVVYVRSGGTIFITGGSTTQVNNFTGHKRTTPLPPGLPTELVPAVSTNVSFDPDPDVRRESVSRG